MRILIATFTYPPNADGVAEATAVLANGLAARGHGVTIATSPHPKRQSHAKNSNPRVVEFDVWGNGNVRVGTHGQCGQYQEFIRQFECDIMIFECWDAWPTHLAIPVLRANQAKKVLVSHGYTAHIWVGYHKPLWGLGPWLGGLPLVLRMPFVMRKFDHLVVLSRRAAWDRFLDHWVAKVTGFKRRSVIPNGALLKEFADASSDFRQQFGIADGPMLLCVANYCDRKNQILALKAFRRAQVNHATLVFIGSAFNEYSTRMQSLDEELKKEFPAGRVLMLEKLNRQQTCAAFRAADLFILSAKAETQPIVLLEAMASHTPFLSTNTGCVAELPGGLVVHSENEMVHQIRALIKSPETRARLGDEGYKACKTTYDWERVVDSYDRLLSKLVGTKPAQELKPALV